MDAALKELVSSGAIGATLVVVLAMLFWMVKVLIANFVKQTDAITKAMDELVAASRAIRDNCLTCRQDSVGSLRDAQKAIEERIDHVVWKSHDQAFSENKDLIAAATEKINGALTGVAQSIRESNKDMELSRPHLTPAPSGVVQR